MLHSPLAFIDAEACAYDNHCKQFPETPYVPSECYEHCALNRASPAIQSALTGRRTVAPNLVLRLTPYLWMRC